MAATMKGVELVYADLLQPNQLIVGDLIKINNEIGQVISIEDDVSGDNYCITYLDDYGDENVHQCTYEAMFRLYVYRDEPEEDY